MKWFCRTGGRTFPGDQLHLPGYRKIKGTYISKMDPDFNRYFYITLHRRTGGRTFPGDQLLFPGKKKKGTYIWKTDTEDLLILEVRLH